LRRGQVLGVAAAAAGLAAANPPKCCTLVSDRRHEQDVKEGSWWRQAAQAQAPWLNRASSAWHDDQRVGEPWLVLSRGRLHMSFSYRVYRVDQLYAVVQMLYFYTAYKRTAGTTFTRISLSLTSEVRYTFTDQGPADHVLKACRGSTKMPLTRLSSVRQWHSCRPRQPESITLVTQLSLERCVLVAKPPSTVQRSVLAELKHVPFVVVKSCGSPQSHSQGRSMLAGTWWSWYAILQGSTSCRLMGIPHL